MDERDAADIDAAGGLAGDEKPGVAVEFAGDRDALLVAAGQAGGRRCVRAALDPEAVHQGLDVTGDRTRRSTPEALNSGLR